MGYSYDFLKHQAIEHFMGNIYPLYIFMVKIKKFPTTYYYIKQGYVEKKPHIICSTMQLQNYFEAHSGPLF